MGTRYEKPLWFSVIARARPGGRLIPGDKSSANRPYFHSWIFLRDREFSLVRAGRTARGEVRLEESCNTRCLRMRGQQWDDKCRRNHADSSFIFSMQRPHETPIFRFLSKLGPSRLWLRPPCKPVRASGSEAKKPRFLRHVAKNEAVCSVCAARILSAPRLCVGPLIQ